MWALIMNGARWVLCSGQADEPEPSEPDSESCSEGAVLLQDGAATSSRPTSLHLSPASAARAFRGRSISPNSSGGSDIILGGRSGGTMAPIHELEGLHLHDTPG